MIDKWSENAVRMSVQVLRLTVSRNCLLQLATTTLYLKDGRSYVNPGDMHSTGQHVNVYFLRFSLKKKIPQKPYCWTSTNCGQQYADNNVAPQHQMKQICCHVSLARTYKETGYKDCFWFHVVKAFLVDKKHLDHNVSHNIFSNRLKLSSGQSIISHSRILTSDVIQPVGKIFRNLQNQFLKPL